LFLGLSVFRRPLIAARASTMTSTNVMDRDLLQVFWVCLLELVRLEFRGGLVATLIGGYKERDDEYENGNR